MAMLRARIVQHLGIRVRPRRAPRNGSESLRAPIRNAASIPRRRKSHHRTNDCSRQFGRKKRFRAAAACIRAIRRADSCTDALCAGTVVFAGGAKTARTRSQRRKPIKRKPIQVASNPPVASRTTPRSKALSRRNLFQRSIMVPWPDVYVVRFQPEWRNKVARALARRRGADFD